MKILLWTQHFWPEEFIVNELAQALQHQGNSVEVLTAKPNYPTGQIYSGYQALGLEIEKYKQIKVYRIPIIPRNLGFEKISKKFLKSLGLISNYLSFIISGCIFAPYALAGKTYDLIFVYATSPLLQAIPAIVLAKLKGVPLVLWVQDLWPQALVSTGYIRNKYLISIINSLIKSIYRHSSLILIQSEQYLGLIQPQLEPNAQVEYFPNPSHDYQKNIDDRLLPKSLIDSIKKQFSIVFTGNIGSVQDLKTLLFAAKTLLQKEPKIKIFIIGEGSEATALRAFIDQHKLVNVIMPGFLSKKAMPAVYAAASVLYLGLKDNTDLNATLPSKMPGYLSAAKPILACMNGVGAEMVNLLKIGEACPAGDDQALLIAILKLFNLTISERQILGDKARKHYLAHFALDKLTNLLMEKCSNLIK